MSHALATELHEYEYQGTRFRGRTGPLYLPAPLADKVESILGIDTRKQAKPHIRRFSREGTIFRSNAVHQSYTPPEVARLYDFPQDLDGSGQRIAIIELGGGFVQQDLLDYFQNLGITPIPTVTSVSVDGAQNSPIDPIGNHDIANREVYLDIEIAGAIAPQAAIDVYFAPNSERGFIDAVIAAILNTRFPPSVISISWGAAENKWTLQAMNTMNLAFALAAAFGITIFCTAGDQGSTDGEPDQRNHVDFPASSPFVIGCGGTRLESENGQVTREEVWNDGPSSATGGGISAVFDLPPWQVNANVPLPPVDGQNPKRGVPDVAGDADPETGYKVRVDGVDQIIAGTSAVAPLWAGLIALANQHRMNQGQQSMGFLNPRLYFNLTALQQAHALRDVLLGDNGEFFAGPDWDPCTGLGTPDGKNLIAELTR